MPGSPLDSLSAYSQLVAEVVDRPDILRSTILVWSGSRYTGVAEGEVIFTNGLRLRMREDLDFNAGLITAYGYEVYRGADHLYWYDDFPHPGDDALAETFPHHKHLPPNIRRNRVPAQGIQFDRPNLEVVIEEISDLGNKAR
jgi:hypothetical protein